MKTKTIYICTMIILILLSCSKGIKVSQYVDKIEFTAGTDITPVIQTSGGSVDLFFNTTTSWSAKAINDRADEWCTFSPSNGGSGPGKITITAKQNTATEDRSAVINIVAGDASKTIKVVQKQKDALTTTASMFEVPAAGQEIQIEVKANIDVAFEIDKESYEWIEYIGTKAINSSILTFNIAKNDDTKRREGSIIIGDGLMADTVKIFQTGAESVIVLNKDEYIAKAEGETFAVEISSNTAVDVHIVYSKESSEWLYENTTRSMSTNTYYFTAKANEEYDKREAIIIFTNKNNSISDTLKVVQSQKDAIILAQKSYNVDCEGGYISVAVNHNVEYTIANSTDWINLIETRGLEQDSVTFEVAENNEFESREASIIFTNSQNNFSDTLKIVQSQKDAIVLAQKSYNVDCDGGYISVAVNHNVEYTIAISTDWINLIETRGLEQDSVTFEVAENNEFESREAVITFSSKDNAIAQEIVVYQQTTRMVVSPQEHLVDSSGGEVAIKINSNVEFDIKNPDCNWIHKVETKSMTEHTIYYKVDENTDYYSRIAYITIRNLKTEDIDSIKIFQSPKTIFNVIDNALYYNHKSHLVKINVEANVDFNIHTTDPWIKYDKTVSDELSIKKEVYFLLQENVGTVKREAVVTLSFNDIIYNIHIYQREWSNMFVLSILNTCQTLMSPVFYGNSVYGNIDWGDGYTDKYRENLIHAYENNKENLANFEIYGATHFTLNNIVDISIITLVLDNDEDNDGDVEDMDVEFREWD